MPTRKRQDETNDVQIETVRTSQSVRTHLHIHRYSTGETLVPAHAIYYIRTYSTGEPLVPVHTIYIGSYIVRGTIWYQPVIPVTPVVVRAYTYHHHSPRFQNDPGRGQRWM